MDETNLTEPKRYRGQRGPGKKPRLVHIGMRIPQYVYDYYGGSTMDIRKTLVEYTDSMIAANTPATS